MLMKGLIALFMLTFSFSLFAKDIVFTWNPVTERADGTPVSQIDNYVISYSVNNVEQPVIIIDGTETTYTLNDVEAGLYVFQIAATEAGVSGAPTGPVTTAVNVAVVKVVEGFTVNVQN